MSVIARFVARFTACILFTLIFATPGEAASVGALLHHLMESPDAAVSGPPAFFNEIIPLSTNEETGERLVSVILYLDEEGTKADPPFSSIDGMIIGSRAGDTVTASVPIDALGEVASLPGIRHIQAASWAYPSNDKAVEAARVVNVWNGSPAYTGAGVLVAVIDTGVDYKHDDFRKTDGTTRIKSIWDYFGTGGNPPPGFGNGVEYTESQINAALGGSGNIGQKGGLHGTHVAGTASGNGRASNTLYRGAAYEADILVVRASTPEGGFPTTALIDAMNYCAQKAQAGQQPVVINMSLGGHSGAHNGTDAQERLVDQLSGSGTVFVIAAGNEGEAWVHSSASAADGTLAFFVGDHNGESGNQVFLEAYVDPTSSPTITFRQGDASGESLTVGPGQFTERDTPAGLIFIDNATRGVDPISGLKQILLGLGVGNSPGNPPAPGLWRIDFSGGSGTVHVWKVFSSMFTQIGDAQGNNDQRYSLGIPGTAEKAITVAAYKTKNTWNSLDGTQIYPPGTSLGDADIGAAAPFSSLGPTLDLRQKPDISAPGAKIVSTLSADLDPGEAERSNTLPGSRYLAIEGTSMATPLTAGIIALMLEKKPDLSADEIRSIIRATAVKDQYTGQAAWNEVFGAGKIDAAAALAAVDGGGAEIASGDIDADGSTTVLDLVKLVGYVVDPNAHPLSTQERAAADVHPPGGGDDLLNISDVTRLVLFILEIERPGFAAPADGPVSLSVGELALSESGWTVPVSISGDALSGAQFALELPAADWNTDAITIDGAPSAQVVARSFGDVVRVLVYNLGGDLPESGFTLHLPVVPSAGETSPSRPTLTGANAAGPHGFARELEIGTVDNLLSGIRFLRGTPNPSRGHTTISYQLGSPTAVKLTVFDVSGTVVRVLEEGVAPAGLSHTTWDGLDADGRPVPAGVYLYRLLTPSEHRTQKIVIAR